MREIKTNPDGAATAISRIISDNKQFGTRSGAMQPQQNSDHVQQLKTSPPSPASDSNSSTEITQDSGFVSVSINNSHEDRLSIINGTLDSSEEKQSGKLTRTIMSPQPPKSSGAQTARTKAVVKSKISSALPSTAKQESTKTRIPSHKKKKLGAISSTLRNAQYAQGSEISHVAVLSNCTNTSSIYNADAESNDSAPKSDESRCRSHHSLGHDRAESVREWVEASRLQTYSPILEDLFYCTKKSPHDSTTEEYDGDSEPGDSYDEDDLSKKTSVQTWVSQHKDGRVLTATTAVCINHQTGEVVARIISNELRQKILKQQLGNTISLSVSVSIGGAAVASLAISAALTGAAMPALLMIALSIILAISIIASIALGLNRKQNRTALQYAHYDVIRNIYEQLLVGTENNKLSVAPELANRLQSMLHAPGLLTCNDLNTAIAMAVVCTFQNLSNSDGAEKRILECLEQLANIRLGQYKLEDLDPVVQMVRNNTDENASPMTAIEQAETTEQLHEMQY